MSSKAIALDSYLQSVVMLYFKRNGLSRIPDRVAIQRALWSPTEGGGTPWERLIDDMNNLGVDIIDELTATLRVGC